MASRRVLAVDTARHVAIEGTRVNAANLNAALRDALRAPGREGQSVPAIDPLVVVRTATGLLYSFKGTLHRKGSSYVGNRYTFQVDVGGAGGIRNYGSSRSYSDSRMTLFVGETMSIFPRTARIAEIFRLTGAVHQVKSEAELIAILRKTGAERVDVIDHFNRQLEQLNQPLVARDVRLDDARLGSDYAYTTALLRVQGVKVGWVDDPI